MRIAVFRAAACAALALAGAIGSAGAAFHLMVIDEVYPGNPAAPDAQYVVLRMTDRGQNFVAGHPILTFLADGRPGPNFGTFAANAPNGAVGDKLLMATQAAVDLFKIPADQVASGRLPFPSGRICFSSQSIDCVAYGAYTAPNGEYGQPAAALQHCLSLRRVAFNELADNNATDFQLLPPAPANNRRVTAGPDADGDLFPDVVDCAPSNNSLWCVPPEVRGVTAALDANLAALVAWQPLDRAAGTATLYDVVAGSAAGVNRSGGYPGQVSCAARDLVQPMFADPGPVAAGDARLYLVRGTNGCGDGTFGDGAPPPGNTDPRDSLDDPDGGVCL
jgi:hypothetical protein